MLVAKPQIQNCNLSLHLNCVAFLYRVFPCVASVLLMVSAAVMAGCSSLAPRNYSAGDAVLFYEPEVVTLSGVLMRDTQPGPPNWESIEAGDRAVSFWYLKTDRAYSIRNSDPDYETYEGDYNYDREDVSEFMLSFKEHQPNLRAGQRISVAGTLYGSHTGWHFKPVVMMVMDVRSSGGGMQTIATETEGVR